MEVIFKAPQKLGNRLYKKGSQTVPDSLAYNRTFQALVKTGAATLVPRDLAKQKIQMSHDMKAAKKARDARGIAKQKLIHKANGKAADPKVPVTKVTILEPKTSGAENKQNTQLEG